MNHKMPCSITDGPQFEDAIPGLDDMEDSYEIERQRIIDDAIEAGDHLRDQRKDDALMDVLEDIARSKA